MKPAVKFGLLAGGILSILLYVGYSFEWYKTASGWTIWTVVNLITLILAIYFGVKEEKKTKYPDGINYRNATLEGLKIIFITAVISSASLYLYFIIQPNKFSEFKNYTIAHDIDAMKKAKYSDADMRKYMDLVNKDFRIFTLAKENFRNMLLFGLLFTLVIASILRKRGDPIPEMQK